MFWSPNSDGEIPFTLNLLSISSLLPNRTILKAVSEHVYFGLGMDIRSRPTNNNVSSRRLSTNRVLKYRRTDHLSMSTDKLDKPTYIFGYGSLIYPQGVNGRGMMYDYGWKDLIPTKIVDHERGMIATCYGTKYYGIRVKKGAVCNGVIIEIHSNDDLHALSRSEHIGEVYDLGDVTTSLDPVTRASLPKNAIVFSCVIRDRSLVDKSPNVSYVERVILGAEHWGPAFVAEFKATTIDWPEYEKLIIGRP